MFLAMKPLSFLAGGVLLIHFLTAQMVGPLMILGLPLLFTAGAVLGVLRLPMACIAFFLWMELFDKL